ncbi:hypothetical protein J3A83DRAFT_4190032 [Scleroderma citrinum]
MTTAPEQGHDLVAVACVIEASITLASEWSRILVEYILPLLKRLSELYPNYQFRLAIVTYGAANTRPSPLLAKRFFSPLSLVTKELREEPSKLGIGQTNCGGSRGLSALEGLVAAIELFDILMGTANYAINPSASPQKDNRSLVSHLLHVAASPPDSAQRPQCNGLQHLDGVSWDTLSTELKKRKINLSLISLRKIQQFQDLQSSVAGSNVQSPWFTVHVPHILLLSGFPAPLKTATKRSNEAPLADRNPEAKRQRVTSNDPSHRVPSGSPALLAAHTPAAQRPTRPPSAQPPHTLAVNPPSQPTGIQPPPLSQSPQVNLPHVLPQLSTPPTSQPAVPQQTVFNAAVLDRVITNGLTSRQLMERLKHLEVEVKSLDQRIAAAQQQGQVAQGAEIQKERTAKLTAGGQIKQLLMNYFRAVQASQNATPAAVNADGPRPVQSVVQNGPGAGSSNQPTAGISGQSGDRVTSGSFDDNKVQVSDAQSFVQFWQSRGGTVNTSPAGTHPQGTNQTPPMPPDVAVQMQKLIDRQGIRPQPFGLISQASSTTPQDTSASAGAPTNQSTQQQQQQPIWHGTFSWVASDTIGQGLKEMQVQVMALPFQTGKNPHASTWPTNMVLKFCKEPLRNPQELQVWVKGRDTTLVQFHPSFRPNDQTLNNQNFLSLIKLMSDRHIYAYTGWPLPNGNYSDNMVIFPTHKSFAGAVFPLTGLPDLPGHGNTLETSKPPVDGRAIRDLSGLNFPPALIARLQNLDPVKQAQVIMQIQQAQIQRHQQQQLQAQSQTMQMLPTQDMGMSNINAVTTGNMGMNFHPNAPGAARPMASGIHNRTVNMEMLQSFMQRNPDGSSSQGANPG